MVTGEMHRYYMEKYPKEGAVVVGKIISLTPIGAYVSLPEYNNVEGLVIYSELTKKRTRNIQKVIKIGSLEGLLVLRVDKEKGYIDLSKKRAQYEDKVNAFEKYYKGKTAHNFMQSISIKSKQDIESLYKHFGWEAEKEFGSLYRCFREVLSNERTLQKKMKRDEFITEELLDEIEELVKQKFVIPKVKVRVDAETKCSRGNGVNVVKNILMRMEKEYPEVEIALVSSPVFSFTVQTEDSTDGEKILLEMLEKLEKRVIGEGGDYLLCSAPVVFGPKMHFFEDTSTEEESTEVFGNESTTESSSEY